MFQSFDEVRQVPPPSRKAYTPDLTRSSHHRNASDTPIVSSLTFDMSPCRSPSDLTEIQNDSGSVVGVVSSEATPLAEKREDTGTDDVDVKSDPVSTNGEGLGGAKERATPSEETLTSNASTDEVTSNKVTAPPLATPPASSAVNNIKKCHMSLLFRQELLDTMPQLSGVESEIMSEISNLSDPDLNVIDLFSRRLPDTVENTILPKREVILAFSYLN